MLTCLQEVIISGNSEACILVKLFFIEKSVAWIGNGPMSNEARYVVGLSGSDMIRVGPTSILVLLHTQKQINRIEINIMCNVSYSLVVSP